MTGIPERRVRPAGHEVTARDLIPNLPLFHGLPPSVIDRLAAASTVVRAPSGTTLFSRGDPCSGIHVLVYGLVKLSVSSRGGSEKVIDILGPGQSFGESFLFFERPHIGCAETISDALLVHVGKAAIMREVETDHALTRNLLARLAERVQRYAADLEAGALSGGTGRLAAFLLAQANGDGMRDRHGAGAIEVELPVCKTVLASRLGVTREHLSRLLRRLTDQHLIDVHGRHVRIHDLAKLREITQEPA